MRQNSSFLLSCARRSHSRRLLPALSAGIISGTLALGAHPASAQLSIVIHPEASLAANQLALNDFNFAASAWTSLITTNTPVTITIDADLKDLGSTSVIGSTNSTFVYDSYNNVRASLASQAVSDPTHDAITASLPTQANFTATVGTGQTFNNNFVLGTLANFKAMGNTTYTTFANQSSYDGVINFNSTFNFNYTTSGAVPAGKVDFVTVATHEIGHLLGFDSATDDADQNGAGTTIYADVLDLYRFSSASLPTTPAAFATTARDLTPGSAASFSDTVKAYSMATGANKGDKSQASHWKDDGTPSGASSLNASYIGIMDPSLPSGLRENITAADLRAFDLIGYTLVTSAATPEPGSLALMALAAGTFGFSALRRRAVK